MTTTMTTLLRLMCIPAQVAEAVVRTSDGHYLGRVPGDVGYNLFLGAPSAPHEGPGRDYMLSVWAGLTPEERRAVLELAAHPSDGAPIPLHEDFGVPVEA